MPLTLTIQSELDERSATAAASRAEKIYTEAAQNMSRELSQGLTKGAAEGGRAVQEMADKARTSYKQVGDATDELRQQERLLKEMRDEGARGVEVQAERVRQARKREKEAIREAAAAYDEYERAAKGAGEAGEQAGNKIISGLRAAAGEATGAGQNAVESFVGGFAGSSALMRLGAAGGPIGAALVGVAGLGLMTGKVLADNIAAGLATMATRDLFQARLGVDEATMGQYGRAAGNAFTDMWGQSVEDNLRAVQFAVQGGVISPGASDAEIENTIAQMQTLATVMEVDVQEAARATGQLIRGGFAADGTEAANIIASGFQRGLDISGDWLDTITEYTTQFRKLGLEGDDALGLLQQGLQGGARDTDVVADSLKEFSIRAVDGSKLTAEGFSAIGLNADDMAARFLAGGESARQAVDVTLTAIKSIDDPVQQALTWQALFGTQWEDMGDAINSMDLSTARTEFGSTEGAIDSATNKLGEHTNQWDVLGRHIDTTFTKIKEWLADSDVGRFLNQTLPGLANMAFEPPNVPADNTGLPGNSELPRNANPLAPSASDPTNLLIPGFTPAAPAPSAPSGGREPGDWGGRPANTPGAGNPLEDIFGLRPGGQPPAPGAPGAPAPPVPGDRTPILTDTQKEAADAAAGGGTLPPAPVLPLQYRSTAGLDSSIASAMNRQDEVERDIAEKEARLNQLKSSNVATAEDIQKAENDLAKASNDKLKADQSLVDAQTRATEKQTKQLQKTSAAIGEFGAELDSDFGISDGLSGILENFTRFVGNLIAAPALAQLNAIAGMNPNEGSGAMGILAANGAFGSQYTPSAIAAASSTTTGASAMGPAGLQVPAGSIGGAGYAGVPLGSSMDVTNQPGLDLLRSMGLKGTTYAGHTDDGAPTDREIDVTDPVGGYGSAAMTQFAEFARQNPSFFEEFIYSDPTTGQKTGIRSGQLVGPGTSQPGYYSKNWAGHQDHAHIEPAKGSGLGFGDGPDDGTGQWNADWNAIAQGESGGNWQTNTGNGFYGGLQFLPSSWEAAGGTQYAPRADLASPYQQAMAGEQLLSMQGPGAWPNTFVPGNSGPAAPGMPPGGGAPTFATGGQPYPSQGGGGGDVGGFGGMGMDAAMLATSGLDMMAPGAGAAAKIGIQVANRTIKYGAQNVGILASGFLDTITPAGDNPKSSIGNSWAGKILGGLAGAAPAIPNAAGGKGKQPPGPMPGPGGAAAGAQAGGAAGNTVTLNQTNNHTTTDVATGSAVREMGNAFGQPGRQ